MYDIEYNLRFDAKKLRFQLKIQKARNEILTESSSLLPVLKSKAEFNNYKILLDILTNLNINNSFKRTLEKRINHFEKSLSKKREQDIKLRQTKLEF